MARPMVRYLYDVEDASTCASDDAVELESEEEPAEMEPFAGPWLVNVVSGWYHKAVCLEATVPSDCGVLWEGKRWGRMCRSQARCQATYEVADVNPFFKGFSACRHAGCFGPQAASPSEAA